MQPISKALLFGILVWAVPFGLGFIAFPLQDSSPKLFDTLMTLAVCFSACFFGYRYLKQNQSPTHLLGLKLGLLWLAICIGIDLPIFLWAFSMPLGEYFQDIGLTYGIIPIVTYFLARLATPSPQPS